MQNSGAGRFLIWVLGVCAAATAAAAAAAASPRLSCLCWRGEAAKRAGEGGDSTAWARTGESGEEAEVLHLAYRQPTLTLWLWLRSFGMGRPAE